MREIVLDTETTGLDPAQGHRVIEIGCIELKNRTPTGARYHAYINPERDVPEEARRISNLSTEFLLDKPLFADVVDGFLAFVGDSALVIHNAEFDLKFLNSELKRLSKPVLESERAIDTMLISRRRFPGASASLDAQLLADVYLELSGGRQPALELLAAAGAAVANTVLAAAHLIAPRPKTLPSRVSEDERARHATAVASLGPAAVWNL